MIGPTSHVPRETEQRLKAFAALVVDENTRQNLVGQSTLEDMWKRHVEDSIQLARFIGGGQSVLDVGSGAGFPGMVLAILGYPVTMVEPRRLRAEFLSRSVISLNLEARVIQAKAEQIEGRFDVITARAVTNLDVLLGITRHLAGAETLWVLPKGRNAKSELEQARRSWHCEVREEPSGTNPDSTIFLIRNVRAKRRP